MGLIGILMLVVLALLIVVIQLVTDGIQGRNWKKVGFSIGAFAAVILVMFFGLLRLITSM